MKLKLEPIFATCYSCNFSSGYSALAFRRTIDISFPGDHESHRCVFSRQKSLDREARIPIQLTCFLPGFRLHRYSKSIRTSLQHHGALHKGARMHMDLDSGAAFPMTDKHYSLL